MKVLLTIWISAALIQEVVPSTLVRYPRQASNTPSFLHTEYEAKIEQKGKHGNESFGTMSGKQAIEHDNCNDNWNAFANKCAALIKDLVASLANSVSSKPGDATNLQLHIKNTFRHLDNTHNCSCLNHTGKGLSDMDLSHLFDNLTLSTISPVDDNDEGHSDNDDESSSEPGVDRHPKKLTSGASVDPEDEEDPNSTSNSRRQAEHEPYPSGTHKSNDIITGPSAKNFQGLKGAFHPFLTTPLPSSDYTSEDTSTIPPLYYKNKHSPLESSSIRKSSTPYASHGSGKPSTLDDSHQPEDSNPTLEAPLEIEPALIVTSGKNEKPVEKPEDNSEPVIFPALTPVPVQNPSSRSETSARPVKIKNGMKSEKPDYDYDEPTSDSTEHTTRARPKHDDDSSRMTEPHSNESPDYDSPTEVLKHSAPLSVEGSKDNKPTIIPITNANSNIPESSEPTTSHNSLSSGLSPSPAEFPQNENSHTEDVPSHSVESAKSEHTTTECDETSTPETVTVSSVLLLENPSADETEDEVLITPRPVIESQTPAIENQKSLTEGEPAESETSDSAIDHENPISEDSTSVLSTDEEHCTTPQSVYPTDEQVTRAPLGFGFFHTSEESDTHGASDKDDEETEDPTVLVKSLIKNDDEPTENEQEEHTTVTLSSILSVGDETTDVAEGNEDHTEVSEIPVLVQPTTFQTTSEDPTRSPISTQTSTKFIPVTSASNPQDLDENTTSESKHEKHRHHHRHRHHHHDDDDDDDDDEDDCCSCESCTEEEDADPQKVRENVCKSLEEARKELKVIFDKIKKKLRCCRKMPHTITTNSSPLPQ